MKHIVCLTFDFDAISGFIAPGQRTPGWISRGEFGIKHGFVAEFKQRAQMTD